MASLRRSIASSLARSLGGFCSERTPFDAIHSTLSVLRPFDPGIPLIRLGREHDGGYLVPDDLAGIGGCFSPGVSSHASFEQDLERRGIPSFLADASVAGPPSDCGHMSFEKRFLGSYDSDTHTTLGSWVARHPEAGSTDLLLQMDIEEAEYDVIPNVEPSLLRRFRILVIEFHKLDWIAQPFVHRRITECLAKLDRDFVPVHLHPNNAGGLRRVGPLRVPRVLEVTYLRRDRCRSLAPQNRFPHPLDRDNVPSRPPITLPDDFFLAARLEKP